MDKILIILALFCLIGCKKSNYIDTEDSGAPNVEHGVAVTLGQYSYKDSIRIRVNQRYVGGNYNLKTGDTVRIYYRPDTLKSNLSIKVFIDRELAAQSDCKCVFTWFKVIQ